MSRYLILLIKVHFRIIKEYFNISSQYYKEILDIKRKLLGMTELRGAALVELPNLFGKGSETQGSKCPRS